MTSSHRAPQRPAIRAAITLPALSWRRGADQARRLLGSVLWPAPAAAQLEER